MGEVQDQKPQRNHIEISAEGEKKKLVSFTKYTLSQSRTCTRTQVPIYVPFLLSIKCKIIF